MRRVNVVEDVVSFHVAHIHLPRPTPLFSPPFVLQAREAGEINYRGERDLRVPVRHYPLPNESDSGALLTQGKVDGKSPTCIFCGRFDGRFFPARATDTSQHIRPRATPRDLPREVTLGRKGLPPANLRATGRAVSRPAVTSRESSLFLTLSLSLLNLGFLFSGIFLNAQKA